MHVARHAFLFRNDNILPMNFQSILKYFLRKNTQEPKDSIVLPARDDKKFIEKFGVDPEKYFLSLNLEQLLFLSKYPGIKIEFENEKKMLKDSKEDESVLQQTIAMYALTISDDEFDVDTLIEAVQAMNSKK